QRMLAGLESTERGEVQEAFYDRLKEEIEALPGVVGVAYTSTLPLTGDRGNNDIEPEGYEGSIVAERRFVSHDFFQVTGVPIVEGRAFQPADDRADAPAHMIVSQGVAALAWPGESAIGKRVDYWGRESTVVGVSANIRDESVAQATDLAFYVPRKQSGLLYGQLLVRIDGDPEAAVAAVRQRIQDTEPGVAISSIQPLSANLQEEIASERYRARLIGVFSALATLFALMGIYGVTTRSVVSRTRELGVRLALGARRESVLVLVLRQGLRLATWGAVAGLAAAFVGTRFIESYLWGVEPTDTLTLVGTAAGLALASVVAALAPGVRAARTDPLDALRSE
ncbi:MAG TPA: ABC transporter permease, partial [Longimicrobiales bacterium]|nr:ABC transporter permease [Longimicrobiales bacterium]